MATSQAYFLARDFAVQTERLLNKTICSNVCLTTINLGSFICVACGISKNELIPSLIPLRIDNKSARVHLGLSYRFSMDPEKQFLAVASSFIQISTGPSKSDRLCHFDYERDKADGYPEAHVQVYGENNALPTLNRATDTGRSLEKLHIPVGGRRFRPSLEDVIEFLVVERFVDAHPGWLDTLNERRTEYRRNQLRAAIRREPEIARDELDKLSTRSPATEGRVAKWRKNRVR